MVPPWGHHGFLATGETLLRTRKNPTYPIRGLIMVNQHTLPFFAAALALLVGTLTGAFVLQLACNLFNRLAGVSGGRTGAAATWKPLPSPKSDEEWRLYDRIATLPGVHRPAFNRAMFVVLVATLVNGTGTFIIFQLLRLAGEATRYVLAGPLPVACIALPMGILVLACINAIMLPTSFGKGLMVSLLSHLLAGVLAAIIAFVVLTFDLSAFVRFGLR
jgi:hypothetical protein